MGKTTSRFKRTRRPAADGGTVLVNFRATTKERDAYARAARDEELTLADWIRGTLDEELRRRRESKAEGAHRD